MRTNVNNVNNLKKINIKAGKMVEKLTKNDYHIIWGIF
jgi:hypothetical protein